MSSMSSLQYDPESIWFRLYANETKTEKRKIQSSGEIIPAPTSLRVLPKYQTGVPICTIEEVFKQLARNEIKRTIHRTIESPLTM